jgi:hypothetical protein
VVIEGESPGHVTGVEHGERDRVAQRPSPCRWVSVERPRVPATKRVQGRRPWRH